MRKTIWQPLLLGLVMGVLAGIATATSLSFLTPGITDNSIGFYVTLFLLAAALGGPLAGATAPVLWVILTALFGPPEMQEILADPDVFWSNLLALAALTALVGLAYRLIYERVKMPARLLPWGGIVVAYYFITLPSSLIPQFLLGDSTYEIVPAVLDAYTTYIPQAIFDVMFTCLVFVALPAHYRRPMWVERQPAVQSMNDGA